MSSNTHTYPLFLNISRDFNRVLSKLLVYISCSNVIVANLYVSNISLSNFSNVFIVEPLLTSKSICK